jgi:hypothetical protein
MNMPILVLYVSLPFIVRNAPTLIKKAANLSELVVVFDSLSKDIFTASNSCKFLHKASAFREFRFISSKLKLFLVLEKKNFSIGLQIESKISA